MPRHPAARSRSALAALLCAGIAAVAACAPADPTACALIFSTNDAHGRLLPAAQSWSDGRPVGGSAALAAYVSRERSATPECPLFVVSGGDIMQGTPISNFTDGRSMIEAMNGIGYDAVSIGNHEFDWGVDVLMERVADADFAMLGANIYLKDTDRHPEWVRPWTIVERDGVRVGFIGATTTSTPVVARPSLVADFDFRPISDALDRYIPEVRAAGVDFVVAVMHEGAFCDIGAEDEPGGACRGPALDALTVTTERFDYAVTGHTHSRVETEIQGVPVIQSYSNTTAYGLGRIDRSVEGAVSAQRLGIRQAWADEVAADPDVERLVAAYSAEIAAIVDRVIVDLPEALSAPRDGDFPLGRIVADAQRQASGADVALMNNGGIRRSLPAGPITFADLFELQPFNNMLVRHTMTGAQLLRTLEHSARDGDVDLHASGITVRYDPDAPLGERILDVTLDDGSPLRPEGRYVVTANDFIATGGGGYTVFAEAEVIDPLEVADLEALVAYLEAQPQPLPIPRAPRWIESRTP
ncbi:bifunctional UDP-sugar hydrolase/5'-nucleotidase [Candidatus Palauibacter soopunensis]|uniref:bifunctional metallophosphatase/5'-nucleotidase n=1 Tax=Candidatus Palauibacter soopunensis TaxID=3056739 RepID=UPI00238F596D|nr:bifunctional UDP-sugar hydrolase/5'-nucleotidase [Candidatus Palauibacter soopunensis]MDE2878535.1 bifunctional UDP-sugar hydrolase/5'-nucleotidase [Candidatus Palauibacter soopunensis]